MEIDKVCAIVDSITYKPGWSIISMASDAVEGVIIVQIEADVQNSASVFAPTYPQSITACRTYFIDSRTCEDDYSVYWLVLDWYP